MDNRAADVKDPITAYLAMHIDLISEADGDVGAYLAAHHAQGYLSALFDIGRIPAATVTKYREDIERLTESRLDALARGPRDR